MTSYYATVLLAFLLTWLIEWLLLALVHPQRWRTVGFVFLINLFTWPLCQLLYWRFPTYLLGIEVLVALTEAGLLVFYYRWPWPRALWTAGAMNAVSYYGGLALLHFAFDA